MCQSAAQALIIFIFRNEGVVSGYILSENYKEAYIGSANLTGAGIGMKGDATRNSEAGILTDDTSLVDAATDMFDSVLTGLRCKGCGRK